jgi:hypothetical protein
VPDRKFVEIESSVVGYDSESFGDWLNKVCMIFVGEGKLIVGLDNHPGVLVFDSLLCFAHNHLKSLVYGVQNRTVISIGYLDYAGIYLEKNVVDLLTRANAASEGFEG